MLHDGLLVAPSPAILCPFEETYKNHTTKALLGNIEYLIE